MVLKFVYYILKWFFDMVCIFKQGLHCNLYIKMVLYLQKYWSKVSATCVSLETISSFFNVNYFLFISDFFFRNAYSLYTLILGYKKMAFFPYERDRHNSSLWLSAILLRIVLHFIYLFLSLAVLIISLFGVLFRKGAWFAPI